MWPKSYSSGWTSTEWVDKWKLPGSFLISNLKNKVNIKIQGLNSPGFKETPLLVHSNGRFHRVFHHSHFMAPLIILAWRGKRHNLMGGSKSSKIHLNIDSKKLTFHPRNADVYSDRDPALQQCYKVRDIDLLFLTHFSVGSLFATNNSDLTSGLTK